MLLASVIQRGLECNKGPMAIGHPARVRQTKLFARTFFMGPSGSAIVIGKDEGMVHGGYKHP